MTSRYNREDERFMVRNRVLLYLRGMEMGAVPGMDMATEILNRAGPEASMEEVFDIMHARLEEQGIGFPVASGPESGMRCFPPLNRRPMLAAPMQPLGILELAGKLAVGVFGILSLRHILWDRR